MWILYGLISALLLGVYDVCKKHSVQQNAVIPVLLLSMCCSTLLLLPMAIVHVPSLSWHTHFLIWIKACLILASGLCGYMGLKYVPITLAAPINATRPIWVVLLAVLLFGESLSVWQIVAVVLVLLSFMLFSMLGAREGFSLKNRFVVLVVLGMLFGAASALYDKYLLTVVDVNRYAMQFYYAFDQALMMFVIVALFWWPRRRLDTPFSWRWSIPCISLFWVASDFVYFYALTQPAAMLSMLSPIRRSGVVIPFLYGAFILRDKNIKGKALALAGVLVGIAIMALSEVGVL